MTSKSFFLLLFSILIDAIGALTYLVPFIGEALDVAWAPISSFLVYQLYGNSVFALFNLIEELMPGMDFIPTACIAWYYYYGSQA
jgi:hypothetical protein